MGWCLNYNTDKWPFYRTSTVPWSLTDFPIFSVIILPLLKYMSQWMFCLVLTTKYCTEIILTHSKMESQKPWLTGIEKIPSLMTSEKSHCYMRTERCENDLKFVMNVLAICSVSLHDNETKNKEGKRMLKLVSNCCKNYFNLSGKCIFETLDGGLTLHHLLSCVHTE